MRAAGGTGAVARSSVQIGHAYRKATPGHRLTTVEFRGAASAAVGTFICFILAGMAGFTTIGARTSTVGVA